MDSSAVHRYLVVACALLQGDCVGQSAYRWSCSSFQSLCISWTREYLLRSFMWWSDCDCASSPTYGSSINREAAKCPIPWRSPFSRVLSADPPCWNMIMLGLHESFVCLCECVWIDGHVELAQYLSHVECILNGFHVPGILSSTHRESFAFKST